MGENLFVYVEQSPVKHVHRFLSEKIPQKKEKERRKERKKERKKKRKKERQAESDTWLE